MTATGSQLRFSFKTAFTNKSWYFINGEGQIEFLAAVDRANLILLVFPLYIDSLPFLMMKSLEVMAEHISARSQESPKRLFAIANNAFPEAHHNAVALSICRRFAAETGMIWTGGLALGAGLVVCQF